MKKMNLTNLLIVSTSILFTACSTKEAPIKKPEKKAQSVEHIIAVQQPSIESLPLAQTYPMPVPEKIEEVVSPAIVSTVVYSEPVIYNTPVVEYTPPRRYRTVYSPPRVNPFLKCLKSTNLPTFAWSLETLGILIPASLKIFCVKPEQS